MEASMLGICVLISMPLIIYLVIKWKYTYWNRLGVYCLKPEFPFGNTKVFVSGHEFYGNTFRRFYEHFKSKGLKYGGYYAFFNPIFMPVDLDLVKNIFQADFVHFMNRGRYFNKSIDPIAAHLFNMENEEWKHLRLKLTPAFTSGKEIIKYIFT